MRRICPGPLGPGGRTKQGLSAPHRLHLDSDRPPHGGWGALVIRASRSLPGRPSAAPVGAGPALDAWQQRTARGGVWDPVDTKKGTARSAGAGGGLGQVREQGQRHEGPKPTPPAVRAGQRGAAWEQGRGAGWQPRGEAQASSCATTKEVQVWGAQSRYPRGHPGFRDFLVSRAVRWAAGYRLLWGLSRESWGRVRSGQGPHTGKGSEVLQAGATGSGEATAGAGEACGGQRGGLARAQRLLPARGQCLPPGGNTQGWGQRRLLLAGTAPLADRQELREDMPWPAACVGTRQAGPSPAAFLRDPSAFLPACGCVGRGAWPGSVASSGVCVLSQPGVLGSTPAPCHLCGQATWYAVQGEVRAWPWGRATRLGERMGQKRELTGPWLSGTLHGGGSARGSAPVVGHLPGAVS